MAVLSALFRFHVFGDGFIAHHFTDIAQFPEPEVDHWIKPVYGSNQ